MNTLRNITLAALFVSALLAAIVKGSRTPQPEFASSPTKRTIIPALIPLVCAGISGAMFQFVLPWYLSLCHRGVSPFSTGLMRVGVFLGGIAPWFVGAYFAYRVARRANIVLRTVGVLELVLCLAFGSSLLLASTVGLG